MDAEADDSTGELIHDHQHPVGTEDQGLAAEEIDAPQAIFAVSEKREPGRASRAGLRPVALGEHTAHDILVDLDTEYKGELLSDPPAAKSRVPVLHFNDGRDQLWSRPLGAWLSTAPRREQKSVLALHQCPVESHDGRSFEHDGCAQQTGRAHQACAEACDDSVDRAEDSALLPATD
jgi:hypothetical protein